MLTPVRVARSRLAPAKHARSSVVVMIFAAVALASRRFAPSRSDSANVVATSVAPMSESPAPLIRKNVVRRMEALSSFTDERSQLANVASLSFTSRRSAPRKEHSEKMPPPRSAPARSRPSKVCFSKTSPS